MNILLIGTSAFLPVTGTTLLFFGNHSQKKYSTADLMKLSQPNSAQLFAWRESAQIVSVTSAQFGKKYVKKSRRFFLSARAWSRRSTNWTSKPTSSNGHRKYWYLTSTLQQKIQIDLHHERQPKPHGLKGTHDVASVALREGTVFH
jgi:hypothetical protein